MDLGWLCQLCLHLLYRLFREWLFSHFHICWLEIFRWKSEYHRSFLLWSLSLDWLLGTSSILCCSRRFFRIFIQEAVRHWLKLLSCRLFSIYSSLLYISSFPISDWIHQQYWLHSLFISSWMLSAFSWLSDWRHSIDICFWHCILVLRVFSRRRFLSRFLMFLSRPRAMLFFFFSDSLSSFRHWVLWYQVLFFGRIIIYIRWVDLTQSDRYLLV